MPKIWPNKSGENIQDIILSLLITYVWDIYEIHFLSYISWYWSLVCSSRQAYITCKFINIGQV